MDNADQPSLLPLEVTDLCHSAQGKELLVKLNFRLENGLRTVILGPNGAGKSLLLRLCQGLLTPQSGMIRWGGQTPAQAGRGLAMVFQKTVLLRRSVADNIGHVLGIMGVRGEQRQARIDMALAEAGLSGLAEHSARTLSGGEQQRLSIARARVLMPRVMLLDEPTSNLDPGATAAVESMIKDADLQGTRIIMTTHDILQARRLAGDVLFLHKGRLLEHSPAGQFFDRPTTDEARRFLRGELLQ
ncbi:MAG: ATP-binding cassette domain-containing protein [Gammaproteobacteria bacterium]|jgi:tungstate transport system ATP-binding protein|nr:ATP-binding cassette domain-containing protein [Gammaproteobacteria bacterium]